MGCLSACNFSNWQQAEPYHTGHKADPRSYCIQKTLQEIAHGGDVDHQLMFAGHNAYRFARDLFMQMALFQRYVSWSSVCKPVIKTKGVNDYANSWRYISKFPFKSGYKK